MDEARGEVEGGNEAQLVWSQSTVKGKTYLEPTDVCSLGMVEVDCSHEQNEEQDCDQDREGNEHGQRRSGEEEQGTPVNVCHGVHDPNLCRHAGRLGR